MIKERNYLLIGCLGVLTIIYGLLFPSLTINWSDQIVENINESILQQDSGKLIVTAFSFTTKYIVIFFLIYLGSIILANALAKTIESNLFLYLFIGISLTSVFLYNQWYQEHFSYLGAIVTITVMIILLQYIPNHKQFYFIISIILLFVVSSSEWLQLVPAFSSFGIGTNDLASGIKVADDYFTGNTLLNTLAVIFLLVFLIIAIILTFLVHLFNKQLLTARKYQQQEEELKETRLALIESAVYQEINNLVHDLKTPIVTIQGLTSLIQMKMDAGTSPPLPEYFNRMDKSLDRMNDMISEILYENIKQYIPVKEVLEHVTSHLALDEQQIDLAISLKENLPAIYVNKIRFSRAIANILENAITSFQGKRGSIQIHVKRSNDCVLIRIEDNGPGIKAADLKNIWKDGFSTKNSSGIGLSFVKKVVENHQGNIVVNSIHGHYTQMTIFMPIHKEGEQYEYNNIDSR